MGILYFHEGQPGSDKLTITGKLGSDIKLEIGSNNGILRIPAELIHVNDKLMSLLDVNNRVLFNNHVSLDNLTNELGKVISSILDSGNKDLNIVQERVLLFLEQLGFNEDAKFDNKNKEETNSNKIIINNIVEEEKRYGS